MKFNTQFNHKPGPGTINNEPSLTQQHFKDECDINVILQKCEQRGSLSDPTNPGHRQPQYGDFSQVPDLLQQKQTVMAADEAFASLPSAIRKRFNNDPIELVKFVSSDKNREEATKLGLLSKPESDPYLDALRNLAPQEPKPEPTKP